LGGLKQLSRTYDRLFAPPLGELRVGSRPLGAMIRIDGVIQKDPTPYTFHLSAGRHQVGVADESQGLAKETTLTVVPGEITRYFVEF
jgi:hypothetical protein